METVKLSVGKLKIPAYPVPAAEALPMFAENRNHQRTSGRPYPNKVVLEVDRSHREEREYTVVTLENEYVRVEILPEIGGRIYAALDKRTGYDFFYKQHVIKPALIGVLGAWISGGVEFNWPFHHRASGFMPCDFSADILPDGSAVCHLSEHDPIDRMKGMVSVILRPGVTYFETRMRLYNRNAEEKSFLWWENAAVPVNEQYQIFFPPDVAYVSYHYRNSRTTYPVAARGVYNGIPMEETDISWHKNTREATSYFSAASRYDFFGGYDHGRGCGVVHVGDHHVSPGKKLFTWAYGQLSRSWEKALTDTDGPYAELMAGSYSDNQPDFSWLAPYETKEFSQFWYPISEIGAPTFANLHGALRVDREAGALKLQVTEAIPDAVVAVTAGSARLFERTLDLSPRAILTAPLAEMPRGLTVTVRAAGRTLMEYTETAPDRLAMPPLRGEMPNAAEETDPDTLYLAGVHVDQYRDPAVYPDRYWRAALARKPDHIPSLAAMAKYALRLYEFDEAEGYARRAAAALTVFNTRTQSGDVYYTLGRILEAKGERDEALEWYHRAAWAADAAGRAMTRVAVLDLRRGDWEEAARHAAAALDSDRRNRLALACRVLALRERGEAAAAQALAAEALTADPLDHLMRYLAQAPDLYETMDSDPVQTCLDLCADLSAMGRIADCVRLLDALAARRPDCRRRMLWYALGYYRRLLGEDGTDDVLRAQTAPLGNTYPFRREEIGILEYAVSTGGDSTARMLLGCLWYSRRQYARAAALWEACGDEVTARRNLAVAYYSHLGRPQEALSILRALSAAQPQNAQLLYETVILMDKLGVPPAEKIDLLRRAPRLTRDDLLTELAKAYNQNLEPERAIETLLSHEFTPCEGGEHAIAEQYMTAHLLLGRRLLAEGRPEAAAKVFADGQTLPQSLGAGIWNQCRRVPLWYFEAAARAASGEREAAEALWRHIAGIGIDFFSNMHLRELPYFQALSWRQLGDELAAERVMTAARREWERFASREDDGYFSVTPFFISYVDDPRAARRAAADWLLSLVADFAGESGRSRRLAEAAYGACSDNLLSLSFVRQGFPA